MISYSPNLLNDTPGMVSCRIFCFGVCVSGGGGGGEG